jgi:uncharacterized protein YnzC (UPF0291/DUF896 family)
VKKWVKNKKSKADKLKEPEKIEERIWTRQYINNLPDSAFVS